MMVVRQTQAADWLELRRVRLESLSDAPEAFGTTFAAALALSELEWQRRAAGDTPLTYFMAYGDAGAVGLAAGVTADGRYELISMWVHPSRRGTGIADALVGAVVKHGLAAGHSDISLDVSMNNRSAWRCYQRCGFVFTEDRVALAGRPETILHRMELRAGSASGFQPRVDTRSAENEDLQGRSRVSGRYRDVEWLQAEPAQAEVLADIRVNAMRESLERIGRFDPQRARDRFLSTFAPDCTTVIQVSGRPVGFYAVRRRDADLYLEHLYLVGPSQGQGLGAAALARVVAMAASEGFDVRLGALMHSDANRFYQRHGFVLENAGEFDNYYVRRSGSRENGCQHTE